MLLRLSALLVGAAGLFGQDPVWTLLDQAYGALRQQQYERAISLFYKGLELAPQRADVRKDLAYTLLKVGQTEEARDQFAEVLKLNPGDTHVALEYAYLCFETKEQREARRAFLRLKQHGVKAAEQPFENIDRPLAEGIDRWLLALKESPDNYSAHEELARLAEQRDQLDLAAEHYLKAWRLKPENRSLLLDLGRVWKLAGLEDRARAALLAASRGAEPRAADRARELLPERYPWVSEFEAALALDPANHRLRRELAYLYLAMNRKEEALREFERLVAATPADLLSVAQLGFLYWEKKDHEHALPLLNRVLAEDDGELADRVREILQQPKKLRKVESSPSEIAREAKMLAERSYQAGYLKDAAKYFQIAHAHDPLDFSVMLRLGWTFNLLHDDSTAVQWFNLARRSPDPSISAEAARAWRNLRTSLAPFRTTVWMFPVYSSRWRDAFGYAQLKFELGARSWSVTPYISLRLIGDARRSLRHSHVVQPLYLSENAVIAGAGVASRMWRGMVAWAEAGSSIRYFYRPDVGRMIPDYRGGLAWARSFGRNIGSEASGLFCEVNADAVYVHRFDRDTLLYGQSKTGYTLAEWRGFRLQLLWNANLTADVKRQAWANFWEHGPGVRFRFNWMPPALLFSISALQGHYSIREGNVYGPTFRDLRAGFWYAFTR
jgi:Tfp pilus assembly protein PilF